jgi:hypothetical protein
VAEANMTSLTQLAASTDQATRDAFLPQGLFDVSQAAYGAWETLNGSTIPSPHLADDPWQNGNGFTYGGPYPQFFWATRNGIRGRDLNR